MMNRIFIMTAMLLCGAFIATAGIRSERTLEKGWKFTRDDSPEFASRAFDDTGWQQVTVPHDWAIYGPFSWDNDRQNVAISQDGQKEAMEHAGRTGGLPFVGTGWYRTEIEMPEYTDGKRVTIMFDGAMSRARLYVNGRGSRLLALRLQLVSLRHNRPPAQRRDQHHSRAPRESSRVLALVSWRRPVPQRAPDRHRRGPHTGMGHLHHHSAA